MLVTSQMEDVAGRPSWVGFVGLQRLETILLTNKKQEWLFIIEGSMTVGIALMLLPLLTDYPLQSKHLFLSRKMQLYAVRDICALRSSLKVSPTLADLHDVIGMEDTERKCRNS